MHIWAKSWDSGGGQGDSWLSNGGANYVATFKVGSIQPSGVGTSASPYQIATLANLYWVSQNSSSWSSYFQQTADIDASATSESTWDSGAGWLPIGNSTTNFTGEYDGAEYTISNLTINRPNTPNVGLFGYVGRDADGVVIKDLGLTNVDIQGARGTGSLVGRVVGDQNNLIIRCFADNGTVIGDGATGGLVGANNSYIENPSNSNDHPVIQESYANIDVSWSRKSGSGADKIGGFAGCNQKGKIYFSYARGSVTVDNDPAVTVSNSDGSLPSRIGGFAGCIFNSRLYRRFLFHRFSYYIRLCKQCWSFFLVEEEPVEVVETFSVVFLIILEERILLRMQLLISHLE